MKRIVYISKLVLVSIVLFGFIHCEDDNNDSDFKDELKLGTGMTGFELTGEDSTFIQTGGSIFLYFRLESKEDMAGRTVVLDFLTSGGSLINTITRPNPQEYGHIMLSSFEWLGGTGNFTVKGYLADSTDKVLIATRDFRIM